MRYKHDCPDCYELGMCENFDLYICGSSHEYGDKAITLIARYSDFESDYVSGLYGITDLALIEARRRALDMGYLSTVDNFSYTFNNQRRKYKHNCTECYDLGMYDKYDLYVCRDELDISLIARYGDLDRDFLCCVVTDNINDKCLEVAKARALDLGYIIINDPFGFIFKTKNLFSTPPYTPTPISEGDCIISSETMAATADLDTSSPTTADLDVSTPVISDLPISDCDPPDMTYFPNMYCRHINMYLTQYIKSESGKRCGLIETFKINVDDFNDNYCINSDYHVSKPFVLITHSKVNPNSEDVFNVDKAYHICDSRSEYMLRVLGGQLKPRVKHIYKMPSTKIINYYKDMYERARRYYKDCDIITRYYDMFEYKNTKTEGHTKIVKDIFDLGIIPTNLFTSTKIQCNVNT